MLERVVAPGDTIQCPLCLGQHELIPGANNGSLLLWFECQNDLHLGAVAGKPVVSV